MSQLLGSNRNQMELFCLEQAVAADKQTLLKGIPKVRGEWAIIFLIYNLKRVLTLLGQAELKKRLGEAWAAWIGLFEAYVKPLRSLLFTTSRNTLQIFTNLESTQRLELAFQRA